MALYPGLPELVFSEDIKILNSTVSPVCFYHFFINKLEFSPEKPKIKTHGRFKTFILFVLGFILCVCVS